MSSERIEETEPLEQQLAPFLRLNSDARLVDDGNAHIEKPWGDDNMQIMLGEGIPGLIDALNALYLPPSLSAIWHNDSSELEIIYSADLRDPVLTGRAFELLSSKWTIQCRFGPSSERLLVLAEAARPAGPSRSNWRNIPAIHSQQHARRNGRGPENPQPTSFWISGLNPDAVRSPEIATIVRHVNFYMAVFDRETPTIVIHEVDEPSASHTPQTPRRLLSDPFPSTLRVTDIDPTLLGFGAARIEAPPMLHSSTITRSSNMRVLFPQGRSTPRSESTPHRT